jgi:hypothetical protein
MPNLGDCRPLTQFLEGLARFRVAFQRLPIALLQKPYLTELKLAHRHGSGITRTSSDRFIGNQFSNAAGVIPGKSSGITR